MAFVRDNYFYFLYKFLLYFIISIRYLVWPCNRAL